MNSRIAAALFLLPSLLSATKLLSDSDLSDIQVSPARTLLVDWRNSGLNLAQRNAPVFTLNLSSSVASLNGSGGSDYALDGASSISRGFNLFTLNGTESAGNPIVVPDPTILPSIDEDGPTYLSSFSPGALLSEYNPVPMVNVPVTGNPFVDDYSRDFSPGSLLFGSVDPDSFQFIAPDVLLAGGFNTSAPVLSEFGVALNGVDPRLFARTPAYDNTAGGPGVSAPPPTTPVEVDPNTSTEPPTFLSAPAVPNPAEAQRQQAAPVYTQPVVESATAPHTIATVANNAMTLAAPGSSTAHTTMPQLSGRAAASLADVPEPGSLGAITLGLGLVGFGLHRRKKSAKA